MKLELFQPVTPYHLNQGFGANPGYYAKFNDSLSNPLKGHDGLDLMAVHGQPVYAAHDGKAWYTKDAHGGEGVWILTNEPMEYENGTCWFETCYWHLIGDTDPNYPPPIPMEGTMTAVKTGDLIGFADNTGAPYESTGDHCHFGLISTDVNGNPTNPGNGFNGRIDPTPFIVPYFAPDKDKVIQNLTTQVSFYSQVVALLKSLKDKLKEQNNV